MNVVHVTTNLIGGAGGAARRLHEGLLDAGVASTVVTREPGDERVPAVVTAQAKLGPRYWTARRIADRLPKLWYRQRVPERSFDPQRLPDRVPAVVKRMKPDVVCVHWVCNAFAGVRSIGRLPGPIVWTLHDMWPLTGGCFYSEACDGYRRACGRCPVLGSSKERDLSRKTWSRKSKAWSGLDLTLVAPSSWMADCARSSSLFTGRRVERIPYGLDLELFAPQDRAQARDAFNLPQDRRLILFGAWGDPRRKGLDLLREALGRVPPEDRRTTDLVVFGTAGRVDVPGLRSHHIGHVTGERSLALLHSAADVTVVPSTWEALGLVALESIACGTPVVAFDAATGLTDVVEHRENGFLARALDPADLATGIMWVLEDPARCATLARKARAKAERDFSLGSQVGRYRALFEDLLQRKSA